MAITSVITTTIHGQIGEIMTLMVVVVVIILATETTGIGIVLIGGMMIGVEGTTTTPRTIMGGPPMDKGGEILTIKITDVMIESGM